MDDHNQGERIRHAVDARLSGLEGDPWMMQRVLANAKGETKVKKKLSVAFIVTVILILLTVGAVAAVLLSNKDFVGQVMAPIAKEDSSDQWTQDQTEEIFTLAEENGLTVTDAMRQKFQNIDTVYKEELMRAYTKIDLGFYPATWSIEDQAWYDDLLVQCGLKEEHTRFLPEGEEISETKAVQTAIQYIQNTYGDPSDVTDETAYTRYLQYMLSEDEQGKACKVWDIEYEAISTDMPSYYILIQSDGAVLVGDSYRSVGNEAEDHTLSNSVATSLEELRNLLTQDDFYTVENMAAFSQNYGELISALGDSPYRQDRMLKLLCEIPYGLPSEEDISQDAAMSIAKAAVLASGWTEDRLSLCKYTISYRIYDPEKPEWRICYKLAATSDIAAYYSPYPSVVDRLPPFGVVIYVDAHNGNVTAINELQEVDTFPDCCEFPDSHDSAQSSSQGVG